MTGSHTRPRPAYPAAPLRRNQSVCRLGPALRCMTNAPGPKGCWRATAQNMSFRTWQTFRSDGFLVRFLRKKFCESDAAQVRQHLQPPVQHLSPTRLGVRHCQPQASSPGVDPKCQHKAHSGRDTTNSLLSINTTIRGTVRMNRPLRQLCQCG